MLIDALYSHCSPLWWAELTLTYVSAGHSSTFNANKLFAALFPRVTISDRFLTKKLKIQFSKISFAANFSAKYCKIKVLNKNFCLIKNFITKKLVTLEFIV